MRLRQSPRAGVLHALNLNEALRLIPRSIQRIVPTFRSLNNTRPRPIAALASSAIRKRQSGYENAGNGEECPHLIVPLRLSS